jgi:hypothetical protein
MQDAVDTQDISQMPGYLEGVAITMALKETLATDARVHCFHF